MGVVVGIDLGTTNSEIAYIKNGKPYTIINLEGQTITPSVVAIDYNGKILFGQAAKNEISEDEVNQAIEVKRLMGTDQRVTLGGREYTPQEISAYILRYLKECAEEYLGEEVTEAVITVPANFNDHQRKATKEAGEIAGLKVERLLSEPTAAALAYGLENDTNGKVLVYDLGGGTFDVSVLEITDRVFEVRGTAGIPLLGGKDFDELIVGFLVRELERKYGGKIGKLTKKQELELKTAAERAKIALSATESTTIFVGGLPLAGRSETVDIKTTLRRAEFEALIREKVASTLPVVEEALKKAKLTRADIDCALVVGGSTRVPLVRQYLRKYFGSKLRLDLNPDEVVALGAAVQAGIKSQVFEADGEPIVTDRCMYSLGTDVLAYTGGRWVPGVYDPLIAQNSVIPCTRAKTYVTVSDNQTETLVNVYQGEAPMAAQNDKIGEFTLDGIPPAPAGEEKIAIEFAYDINSILQVTATNVSTGKQAGITIRGNGMSWEVLAATKAQNEREWRKSKLAERVESLIDSAERKIVDSSTAETARIQAILQRLKEALVAEDEARVDELDNELTNELFDVM